jgi:hypothetical protein
MVILIVGYVLAFLKGPSEDRQIMDRELIFILGGYIVVCLALCLCALYLL